MVEELCEKINNHQEFKSDFEVLSKVNNQILFHQYKRENYGDNIGLVVKRLLQCATTFALSEKTQNRKLAYEIAVMCLNIDGKAVKADYISQLVPLVFTRLGNFPAENKYKNDHSMGTDSILPPSLWFEQEEHRLNNTVNVSDKYKLTLTDFQIQLWNSVKEYPVTIVNAPTSAGKSFILQNHIVNYLNEKCRSALYIVPTRALIEQVINDFRKTLKDAEIKDIVITSIPEIETQSKVIYVLTQERTQLLLENDINLDIAVIDEAQNVSDNARGIILQSVIEIIKQKCQDIKFIFATPFVQNPKVFLSMFSLSEQRSKIIPVGESPVSQNLFNVSIENDNSFHIFKLSDGGTTNDVGLINSKLKLVNENRFLAILALTVGDGKNNIIYGSEQKKCEDIAQLVYQELPEDKNNKNLIEFSDFIKEHIHKDYLLAETVKHGVAYHYGRLPSFLRKGIERLCVTGDIKYIICTSTLLQGINLPSQNIYIMNPSKGRDDKRKNIPMSVPDFWNLAGRAGRLTKDYEGNVFMLNLDKWDINPIMNGERRTVIAPSFKKCVCDLDSGLCEYIENPNHKSGNSKTQNVENAFMKLYFLANEGRLNDVLDDFGNELSIERKNRIIQSIEHIRSNMTLPDEIVLKNPNVSVYRQQALNKFFTEKLQSGIKNYIPLHPMKPKNQIMDSYLQLFKLYDTVIANDPNNNRYKFFYWFSLDWMNGTSYKDMLSHQIEHKKTILKKGEVKINTEARKLFDDIETNLRFTYVKFSKCYNDILTYVLCENGLDEMVKSIPPLHLYLELGASSETMINLIGVGLSRTSAGILSHVATNSAMNRDEVISWIKNTNFYAMDIPQSVTAEIAQLR